MKALIISILFASSITPSFAALDYASSFCQDPVNAICSDNPNRGGARDKKAASFIEKEATETMIEVAVHFQIPTWVMASEQSIVDYLSSQTPERREAIVFALYDVGMSKLGARYAEVMKNVFSENIKILFKNFHATIDRVFPAGLNSMNQQFHQRVNEIIVLTASDVNTKFLRQAFVGACGVFGSNQNAFAFSTNDGKRYLLVCPGWALGKIDTKYAGINNFVNFVFVASHEIGHHLDSGEYPETFKAYLAKFATQHGSKLADPIRGKFEKFTIYTFADRVASHAKEITADVWASESLATFLVSSDKPNVFQPRMDIIRESFGVLCDSQDEGIHPSGEVRAMIVGENPSVRAAMFCQ